MDLSAFDDLNEFDDLLGGGGDSAVRAALAPDDPLPPASGQHSQPQTIHESDLAALLGITRQAVGEKVRSGILKRTGRALYIYPEAVRDYCAHLREHAGRAGRPSATGDSLELKAEKLRLTKAQADAQETKVAKERGELVPVADTLREWQAVLRDIRAAMLAVPSQFASTQPHLTVHDIEALTLENKRALEGLADGNA
ncbi:terminase small subunit [uncultured Paracoccus sp.]|uniref:terminase small subunit n=1 Tax=uncultured Paracoccus sp. TaxID=189685 RepID=UPI0025DDE200|nr:terminase small subunit [uncultured Paracoccus sp.]